VAVAEGGCRGAPGVKTVHTLGPLLGGTDDDLMPLALLFPGNPQPFLLKGTPEYSQDAAWGSGPFEEKGGPHRRRRHALARTCGRGVRGSERLGKPEGRPEERKEPKGRRCMMRGTQTCMREERRGGGGGMQPLVTRA
jgi:hypothetical protein